MIDLETPFERGLVALATYVAARLSGLSDEQIDQVWEDVVERPEAT